AGPGRHSPAAARPRPVKVGRHVSTRGGRRRERPGGGRCGPGRDPTDQHPQFPRRRRAGISARVRRVDDQGARLPLHRPRTGRGGSGLVEGLGVTTVVDLRTPDEIATQPDVVPAGAEYLAVDVLAGHTSAATFTGAGTFDVDDARREMALTYERFVLGEDERAGFGRAVHALARSTGPAIVHCTAGKDRT